MARNQAQNVVVCQMCPNPVENHCNLCHVDLCSSCSSRAHEREDQETRNCRVHQQKERICSTEFNFYQKNPMWNVLQRLPYTSLCIVYYNYWLKHDFTCLGEITENRKQQIIGDLKELENVIVLAYRNVTAGEHSAEFDKVFTAIQDHEDEICRMAHDIGNQMREQRIAVSGSKNWKATA